VNLDIEPPRNPAHRSVWRPVDLLDAAAIEAVLREVRPSLVLHFASRTDLEGATIEDYACAIAGTRNLISAIDELGRVGSSQLEQVVFASGEDLVIKTPQFFEGASKRLNVDLGGCHTYAQKHFGGQNLYLEEVGKNINFAQEIGAESDSSVLKRKPPETLKPAS
jgi:hypothetical protein